MSSIRMISNEILTCLPNTVDNTLVKSENYILPSPEGDSLILAFVSHKRDTHEIPEILLSAIKENLGVIYVCDELPKNPLIDNHIYYLVAPERWMIHTLFLNPLKFASVFATPSIFNLARAFSSFTKYHIPILNKEKDLKNLIKNVDISKNNILVEISGGVGDHLITIPSLKTLAEKGNNIFVLCEAHRNECFQNLKYIKGFYCKRDEVDISRFKKIIYLNFGQLLNDYRQDLNKQNRIYSVAELCGLRPEELVIDRPEIILTPDEKNNANNKWGPYLKKVFLGYDSARVDSKLPSNMTQIIIDRLKAKGYTIFTASNRNHSFLNCIDLNKKTTLRELFALIAMMDCVFTVDTAFLHISAAFNKKTFCLMNYFKPDWRCSTYKNCTAYTPKVSCFPCVSKQFVNSKEWQCHNKSCYEYHDIEQVYSDMAEYMQNKYKPESETIQVSKRLLPIPEIIDESTLPGKVIKARKETKKRIAAFWMGGIGDAVMLSYLCRAIQRKYPATIIDAFVRDINQVQLFVFDYPNIRGQYSTLGWDKTLNKIKDNYDIIYEFRPYTYVWNNSNPENNKELDKELYRNWQKSTNYILNNVNEQTFQYYAQQTDLELLDSDLRTPIFFTEQLDEAIKIKYALPKNYITINSGCDSNVGILKLWSKKKWEDLIDKLKADNIEIIHLGGKKDIEFKNIEKLSCDNLIDLMYVLKGSSLNICNEGGLVHLAHSVGVKSVVLFGPTKPELYGYPDNINIYSDICPSCWWTTKNWSNSCKLGNRECINLSSINVDKVYNVIIGELNR